MLAGVRKMSNSMFGSGDHELSEKSVVDKKKVERAKSMRQSMGTALFEMDESITTLDKDALFALADDADGAWDFEWLLPARGRAVRFASPTDARDALRGAARRAASVARAGKG